MIKEKKKNKKDVKKELKMELINYIKTAFISFCVGAVIALLLSFHARSEMIRNLYVNKHEKTKIEAKFAKELLAHSDFISELNERGYSTCMRVGNLYEIAGDYKNAEYAYYLAKIKASPDVYTPYYKLIVVLLEQDKIDEAEKILNSVVDKSELNLIKFKTRACIVLGDKYYSKGKFIKAAHYYENANYYYTRLKNRDKYVEKAIIKRLVGAYTETAGVIVKSGYNSDAVKFLNKALKYDPQNYKIKYRLAIVYSDSDPIKAVEYFEPLIEKIPQEIDYNVYNKALMKAANIEDIQGNGIKAKYYRYKVHSLDLFINQKVIYKDDIEVLIKNFSIKKILFRYRLKTDVVFTNISSSDIKHLTAEFVLRQGDREREVITKMCASKKQPLYSNGGETDEITIKFGKNIFTKKELENYAIDIYLYKDKHFKTLVGTYKIPLK